MSYIFNKVLYVKAKPIQVHFGLEIDEISEKTNLNHFVNYLKSLEEEKCFTKLFEVCINNKIKDLIKNTQKGRNLVSDLNNLPDYMKRDNQESIDAKSLGTEIPFSVILRSMNEKCNHKVILNTPELNTLTPNKDKPDYIVDNFKNKLLFDMKGQYKSNTININKIAHDRAISQGLTFYIVGIIDNDNIDTLNNITYYHLPLKYFLEKAKFVDNGKYSNNPRNHYYAINMNDIKSCKLFN